MDNAIWVSCRNPRGKKACSLYWTSVWYHSVVVGVGVFVVVFIHHDYDRPSLVLMTAKLSYVAQWPFQYLISTAVTIKVSVIKTSYLGQI